MATTRKRYHFKVMDSEGTWGDMRMVADSAKAAEANVNTELRSKEVIPYGSLLPDYVLTLTLIEDWNEEAS